VKLCEGRKNGLRIRGSKVRILSGVPVNTGTYSSNCKCFFLLGNQYFSQAYLFGFPQRIARFETNFQTIV